MEVNANAEHRTTVTSVFSFGRFILVQFRYSILRRPIVTDSVTPAPARCAPSKTRQPEIAVAFGVTALMRVVEAGRSALYAGNPAEYVPADSIICAPMIPCGKSSTITSLVVNGAPVCWSRVVGVPAKLIQPDLPFRPLSYPALTMYALKVPPLSTPRTALW